VLLGFGDKYSSHENSVLKYRQYADGTWKRFGKQIPEEEPVAIFHRGNASLEGEYSFPQAIAIVEEMIRKGDPLIRLSVLIQSAAWRIINEAFGKALTEQRKREVSSDPAVCSAPVPSQAPIAPDDMPFIEICKPSSTGGPDIPVVRIHQSDEVMQLIKKHLRGRLSGRICDWYGKELERWPRVAEDKGIG
jgi:hypothetical protein